jgi:hypothetical protein
VSGSPEDADPLSAGATKVLSYEQVPLEERGEHTLLQGPRTAFAENMRADGVLVLEPVDLEVGPNAYLYVLDAGDGTVKVFDDTGVHVRSFGRRGQGPGEMQRPERLAVTADRVIVNDIRNARLSVWDLHGVHIADYRSSDPMWRPHVLIGTPGAVVASITDFRNAPGETHRQLIKLLAEDGQERGIIADLPRDGTHRLIPGGEITERRAASFNGTRAEVDTNGRPRVALADGGAVFVSASMDYVIESMGFDGSVRWRLRVAQPKLEFPQRPWRLGSGGTLPEENMVRPAHLPAIWGMNSDGQGNLYVAPRLSEQWGPSLPVDVYSPTGDRLWTGIVPTPAIWTETAYGGAAILWNAAFGDFVYVVEETAEGDPEIQQYRISLPPASSPAVHPGS